MEAPAAVVRLSTSPEPTTIRHLGGGAIIVRAGDAARIVQPDAVTGIGRKSGDDGTTILRLAAGELVEVHQGWTHVLRVLAAASYALELDGRGAG